MKSQILMPHIGPKELMKCALSLRRGEIEAYISLLEVKEATVQEVAQKVRKSRPTTQRCLQDLVGKSLAVREEAPIGRGGYEYRYSAISPEVVRDMIEANIDAWHKKMKEYIRKFPNIVRRSTIK